MASSNFPWRKKSGKGKRQASQSQQGGAGARWSRWWKPHIEELESRLAPAANLTYADFSATPSAFDPQAIAAYAIGLVSTNFTLRAEQDGGGLFWRLYGTGTDVLPIPLINQVPVVEYQITQATDLDVNVTRDDNGANNIVLGLGLIDFVGDRLTVDLDSLSVLNGQFAGTTIDIDFAGGKDLDLGAIFGVVLPSPLTILDDQMVLAGTGAGGTIQHPILIHSSSDIADIANAPNPPATVAIATVNGDLTVKSDSRIVLGAGSSLNATNIVLDADSAGSPLVKGIRANATAEVTVNGATLTATTGTVTLNALGKVDMTGTKAEDGDSFFGNTVAGTVVTSFSTATVNIVGATTITAATLNATATVDADIEASVQDGTVKILTVWAAGDARVNIGNNTGTTTINVTGDLTAEAKSDVHIDAKSKPGNANNSSVDAAVVNVNVVDPNTLGIPGIPGLIPAGFTSGADMTVGGGAVITANNKATFKATDLINATTLADGAVASTAGATFAVTVIDSTTTAAITGNAAVTSPTVDLLASTTRTIATTAKSTPGGAQDDNNPNTTNKSQQGLADNNAKTSDGDLTIAGAVAVSHVQGTTNAFVNSTAPTAVTAGTALNVGSTSTDSASAVADASGTGSPGLAVAAALNFVDLHVNARLGTTSLQATTVNVTATENAASTFKADATSGAGSSGVGIAGALSINSVDTATRAFVANGSTVNLHGGSLNLTATSSTKSTSEAKPKEDGVTGESLGLGASVALNLVNNLTEAMVENGATVTGAAAVKFAATGDHDIETKATMSASGGTAITPVVALTFATDTTRVVFDTGSSVSGTGNIDGEATQDVDITTEGKGDAEGSGSLAAGGVFAFSSVSDVVAASALGTLTTTTGNVGLKSKSRTKSNTNSTASAGGAESKDKNGDQQDVDDQAAAQKSVAQDQGGQGSSKGMPSAKTSEGPVTIAAAVSISVVQANVSATVGGTINAANGTVTMSSLANQDDSSVADGEATKAGSVGVGAAVAISRADLVNLAQVQNGGSVTADGIIIEAGMRDVSGDKQHEYATQAKSGAGSEGGIGIAGALAITISTTDTRAGLATGSTVTLADGSDANTTIGELKITATEDAKNTAKAEPTVSGDSFGFGASVALAIPTHKTTAAVEDEAVINGAGDVTLLAKSNLDTNSFAKAGVKAGVALSPVVAVSLVETTTLARMGTGNTTLAGNLTITADHTGASESRTDGSVESSDAAIGLSVAVTTTQDQQDARLERSITAGGNITVEAVGLHDDSALAKATARGAKDKDNDSSNKNVDQKTTEVITTTTTQQQQNNNVPAPPPGSAFVYFDTAVPHNASEYDASIKPGYRAALDEQAQYLVDHPTAAATVYGYTDTVGGFEGNLALAKRRAEAIRDYLVSKGASASQIRIEWLGEAVLEVSTADNVEKDKNRRAEVIVTAPDAVTETRTVLFDTDEDELDDVVQPGEDDTDDPNDKAIIDEFAAILLANPTAVGTVIGHTDTKASHDYNIGLSMRRAQSVANYLINVKGVPASQLRVGWHGEIDLAVPTGDEVEENANRRVKMTVTYSDPPAVPVPPPVTKTTKTTTTKTKPGSGGGGTDNEGAVAVAAAVAINLPDSHTSASIGGGVVIVAQGSVTVRGRANSSDLALADGSAVTVPEGYTVGAAVAINVAETDNRATVAGANITADGITVETVMTDNKVGLTAAEPETVDVDADTIFVGEVPGLTTGEKVKYTKGASGTELGGLTDNTDYFVINLGAGKIKLATSQANAEAGTAIDLTSQGAGDAHKLDRADPATDITFDPDQKRVELALARDKAWVTGTAVVYDNGGGSNFTGLTNGATYFLIVDGSDKVKLASSRENALKGQAITLTPGGGTGGTGHSLTEAVHNDGAQAISGATGGKLGVAGSLALNISTTNTEAMLLDGAAVTSQDGSDAGSAIGAVKLSATNTSESIALGTASAKGTSVGVGASFGINVVENNTRAALADGSTVGGRDLTLSATGNYATATLTTAGAGSPDGTAVGGAFAITVADNATTADLETGTPVVVTGAVSATATHHGESTTTADGTAMGADAAVGAAIALAFVNDTATATTARNITADGAVTFVAQGDSVSVVTANASAAGASKDNGSDGDSSNDKADTQKDDQKNLANSKSGNNDSVDGNAETSGDSGGSSVGVAAALAINVVHSDAHAEIPNAVTIHSGGLLTVRSRGNADGGAVADGKAVNSDVGVGVAVPLNLVYVTNTARIGGTITAAGRRSHGRPRGAVALPQRQLAELRVDVRHAQGLPRARGARTQVAPRGPRQAE